jgi:hypothetical protein
VAHLSADKRLQFQFCLSNAWTEAMTWSLADTERVTIQLELEIYCITSNAQKRFQKEFSVCMIKCEAWSEISDIQELVKTIEQRAIHFGYPKIHLVRPISESNRRMGSSDNFTPDICKQLPIANLKEAYWSSNIVNYI